MHYFNLPFPVDANLCAVDSLGSILLAMYHLCRCVEELGVRPKIARYVLPLGTGVNGDGAALYEAVSVLFLVQVCRH
jgi:Na+/H+-dicarboxylate symporter